MVVEQVFAANVDIDEAATELARQQAELFGNAQRGSAGPDVAGAQSAISEAYQVTLQFCWP